MIAVAIALSPHLTQLPFWIPLLIVTAAMWRVVIETRAWRLPPRWLRILIAAAAMAAVAVSFRTLNGLEAGTALLAAMAGIKLLETRGARDCTMLIFIGFVLLFAALLYDHSLLRLPYILGCAWLLGAALLRIHQSSQSGAVRAALRKTGTIVLQALPVAVLLFLFFPRLPGQFWALPSRSAAATGLNDEMTPGDISELTLSNSPAFRVKFDGAIPPPAQRYWRGPVLHDFDGRRWRRDSTRFIQGPEVEATGPAYNYRLTLEPTQRNWLFALDVPTQFPRDQVKRLYDLQLEARRPFVTLASFDMQSRTSYRSSRKLLGMMRALDVRWAGNTNPRTRAFAQQLRASTGSDQAFVQAILDKFRREEFYYTLTPPLLQNDSVDDFLFNTRRGFCEHFASAFATLMRAANIPARVVTGYQGGEYNSLGDYLLVRQSDAHAWTEVWLEDRGWVRVDPTAAIAPERIEKNLDAAISEREFLPGRFLRTNPLFASARLAWDAVNNFWNNRIVEYDQLQQRSLMAWLGINNADWRQLGIAFTIVLVLFFVSLTAYLGWQYRPRKNDPIIAAYARLCRKLSRVRLERAPYEGPVDYLRRAAIARPESAATLDEACSLYVDLRYGPAPQIDRLKTFKSLINKLAL
ncbi:MAG TPA: DUF3488 and transglutaminase-like domain-containing protein [Steroidobacteraceae bacterium]|nr:DUF3488 and transglutaminase-like domain-containing protein [Steroidobacteraceae bacterium]